ncbi:MAG: hypothetical protein O2960_08275 [Verrucomicrobia bacterium]|nr:hypothetical protein [Verrucomicrobiota bacterium]
MRARALVMQQVVRIGVLLFFGIVSHAGDVESRPLRPDLTGMIRTQDGAPLRDASVFIYTAGPRTGLGFL